MFFCASEREGEKKKKKKGRESAEGMFLGSKDTGGSLVFGGIQEESLK